MALLFRDMVNQNRKKFSIEMIIELSDIDYGPVVATSNDAVSHLLNACPFKL